MWEVTGPAFCSKQAQCWIYTKLFMALSSQIWKPFKDREPFKTSQRNLCLCLITGHQHAFLRAKEHWTGPVMSIPDRCFKSDWRGVCLALRSESIWVPQASEKAVHVPVAPKGTAFPTLTPSYNYLLYLCTRYFWKSGRGLKSTLHHFSASAVLKLSAVLLTCQVALSAELHCGTFDGH